MFTSLQDAWNWLQEQVGKLFQSRSELQGQRTQALNLIYQAKDATERADLFALLQDIDASLVEQDDLESRVRAILPNSLTQSLGLAPLVIPAAALAVATAVYFHFQNVTKHRQQLDLIASGKATPEQLTKLEQSTSILGAGGLGGLAESLTGLMWAGVIGAGLFLAWPFLKRVSK